MNRNSGFGLLEVLIALTITGLISLAMSQLMAGMFKGQQRVDQKAQLLDFGNRVRALLYDEKSCNASLVGDSIIEFEPTNLVAFNSSPALSNITLRFGDGTSLTAGAGLDLLHLRILNEVLPEQSGKYEATLVAGAPGVNVGDGAIRPLSIPLVLQTQATGGTKRRVTGCFTKAAAVDAPQTCTAIGGRWLSSLSRCYFGGDLKLGQFECLPPEDLGPGGVLEGAVIAECYRRVDARQKAFECINNKHLLGKARTNNTLLECACQPSSSASSSGWVIRRNSTVKDRCDGGVMVRVPETQESFLVSDEITENRTTSASSVVPLSQWLSNYDLLNNVTECYPDPNSYAALKCAQGENAVRAGRGSCVFVNGAAAQGHRDVFESTIANYTGWMWVTRGRTLASKGTGANRKTEVIEATGRKCYMVKTVSGKNEEINNASPPTTAVADPFDASLSNVLQSDRWRNVSECMFIGGVSSDANPLPTFAGLTAPGAYRGRYLSRLPCDQEGISMDDSTGTLTPSLGKGACWYFSNAILPNDFAQSMGVSFAASKARFTGWLYLTRELPEESYLTDSNLFLTPKNNSVRTFATPCNVGVRISP